MKTVHEFTEANPSALDLVEWALFDNETLRVYTDALNRMNTKTFTEDQFYKISEMNYVRRAQIPIYSKRFDYLVNQYSPENNDKYIMFHHPGHFLVYDKRSRYCLYDASYIGLIETKDVCEEKDIIEAVITEIKINEDEKQRASVEKDDFGLLCDLILKDL